MRFRGRLYVPPTARQELCDEAHRSKLSIHPSGNKMYQNVVARYEEGYSRLCFQMLDLSAGQGRAPEASRFVQPLPISEWK